MHFFLNKNGKRGKIVFDKKKKTAVLHVELDILRIQV